MKTFQLKYKNGIYSAPIDITVDEWKEMLQNKHIFNDNCLKMLVDWYNQPFHQATSKEIMFQNNIKNGTPYNGIVVGLGKRIVKHLNRFEVLDTHSIGKSYFIIIFEGWYENYDDSGNFVWKLRDELSTALEELKIVDCNSSLNNLDKLGDNTSLYVEGNKTQYYTTKYERNIQSRKEAIKIHGTVCQICGFDFGKVYGSYGQDYIEVHHIKPLSEIDEEVTINPETDLICVCANCHRMIHRRKRGILMPKQLKKIINDNKTD